jgi:hypothetical protein
MGDVFITKFVVVGKDEGGRGGVSVAVVALLKVLITLTLKIHS